MSAAERDIDRFLDRDLFAFGDGPTFHVATDDHGGFLAAMADGADFAELVGDGEERHGTGEELALEVGAQAEGHHRNFEPVGHPCKLPDLVAGKELSLVDEDAIDLAS